MAASVLIVDDSSFIRHRISDALARDPRLKVVGTAVNGVEAVEKARQLRPDVITMDVEMPQMNGIEAVRRIMREAPTSILMLSSLTHEGAQTTLQALEAGAVDYLPKDIRAWLDQSGQVSGQLIDRLVSLARSPRFRRSRFASDSVPEGRSASTLVFRSGAREDAPRAAPPRPAGRVRMPDCRLVVIGSSTGGPAALQQILTQLPASFPYPILLVQHMPATFTRVFAERLDQQCRIRVRQAEDGDRLEPGLALLAPGGQQMIIDGNRTDRVRILPGDERLTYKPSVDITYGSAARAYGRRTLALILTGMGADGCEGAKLLKKTGATIWAQNQQSCTIYGMPQAVVKAGLADAELDLSEFGPLLAGGGH
ncbi:chemotaxis response regulator protein-glutamate methylesterase of group 1 operon [Marinobacterium nitratireducens]|uniref:Protein-glutamate methylesterase/protein-glutamine glutaminase n=1 Tax=Marinobacterium nitratireducens TaxID=518897 RepID=A0A917ZL82_9GAMM|nr:chemotaxis response regulator protein-glutamate methylesterase [Marinobacterium nitratireducens]GGO85040.1 chemotaxis response regulator protein-glutamate methylesterase of group 1 operon [Marinobacterium nitratireducens]